MDEYASKEINPFESVAKGDSSIGHAKSDGSIHCGNNVYISKINYDNAKNKLIGKKDYAPLVKEVAVAIVGLRELKAGSVTGRPCNHTGGPAKPKIDPAKLGAIYGIFRHYLLTDQKLDPLSTDIEVKKVSKYVAQKISDINRKQRKPTKESKQKSEKDSKGNEKKDTKDKENSNKEEQKHYETDDENTKNEKHEGMKDDDIEEDDGSDESSENSESASSESEENCDNDS